MPASFVCVKLGYLVFTLLRICEPATNIASADFYAGAAGVAQRYAMLSFTKPVSCRLIGLLISSG
jgi:hypothetical protein